MKNHFRETHLFTFLNRFEQEKKPLDLAFSNYLRLHKNIGAHDRRFLGDTIYALIRWKSLLDYLHQHPPSWPERYALWQRLNLDTLPMDLPDWVRGGATPWLFEELARSLGKSEASRLCRAFNDPAPITIRVNLLKTTREALLSSLQGRFEVIPCTKSASGLSFSKRTPLTALPEFQEGLFEIQDEGSQLVADLVQAKPGDHVLDFCSGSGGKTLAIAPRLQGKGQLYLHDIRPWILQEAKKRLRRAGVQNAQFLTEIGHLAHKMDWVLVDAPCSGSGTYRRNPDMKLKADEAMLERLILEQRSIFHQALSFVKPGGQIVYATCSLFARENERQVEHFLANYPLTLAAPPLATTPAKGEMDGFFAARFSLSSAKNSTVCYPNPNPLSA